MQLQASDSEMKIDIINRAFRELQQIKQLENIDPNSKQSTLREQQLMFAEYSEEFDGNITQRVELLPRRIHSNEKPKVGLISPPMQGESQEPDSTINDTEHYKEALITGVVAHKKNRDLEVVVKTRPESSR